MRHATGRERELGGLRLVAEPPRHDGDGLTRSPRARHDDGERAILPAQRAQPQGGNRDLDLSERQAGIARHLASDGHRLLRGKQGREREQRAENDEYDPTRCDLHVPSDGKCDNNDRRRPRGRRPTFDPHCPLGEDARTTTAGTTEGARSTVTCDGTNLTVCAHLYHGFFASARAAPTSKRSTLKQCAHARRVVASRAWLALAVSEPRPSRPCSSPGLP